MPKSETENPALREALEAAAEDEAGLRARREFGECLAASLRTGGRELWIAGAMIGPDRAAGESPFEFGSDATVGLATVLQIAGELVSGAIALFAEDNRYAGAALVRQLVEVEYLAWAFAEDEEEARNWMRSSKDERQRIWKPAHIRERAGSRFRGLDYSEHCGKGGHPSPEGIHLLPDHSSPEASASFWWCDMAIHGHSVWRYAVAAAERLDQYDTLMSIDKKNDLERAARRWRDEDPFVEICRRLNPPMGPLAATLKQIREERGAK